MKKMPPQLMDPETHRDMEAISAKVEKHDARIRSLEDDRLRIRAWAALIMFSGSIAAFFAGKFWPT
jgi:hypothetical protein